MTFIILLHLYLTFLQKSFKFLDDIQNLEKLNQDLKTDIEAKVSSIQKLQDNLTTAHK